MLEAGVVVESSFFPELVKFKKCEQFDSLYVIEAVGIETNRFYERIVKEDEFNEFYIKDTEDSDSITGEELQKYLQYASLEIEQMFSKTKALGNADVIPLPHQIEAVYGRMLQTPIVRFLLADDPGAGKTIMAGMIIKELMARLQAERILILVPPLVLKQWQEELNEKFGLHFHIINRNTLREYGNKNPFIENKHCLASMYWSIQDDVRALIQEASFDLIIVDEAHKMAAYTQGTAKKKVFRTKLYQLGESILRNAKHCLLLTATPHKGDTENFRHLMKLIDEDVFSSSSVNESLRERANPFIIRRLKENLNHFDGTPIFPKRTSKTIQFDLTDEELDLYEDVTNYVRFYFNRAVNNDSNSTAFAMMLLQRRLSSSSEAIYLSLQRRLERLQELFQQTEKERNRYARRFKKIDTENYLDESGFEQERIEKQLEESTDVIDLKALEKEVIVLKQLIKKAEAVRLYVTDKKYQELEETLFGVDGLIAKDEKILIFTESIDTLRYIESNLLQQLDVIAKITGDLSMNKRREQVELFRSDSCQVMVTTDAGGESINLQFCNQLINYDIPWNPNKLEQRMGRIHRIGQNNEVFIFNMVAKNTREGNVMVRLLDKMEQMSMDLGSDLVYDFIGEVMEDNFDSMANLMQDAIVNRENLNDIIANMDKTLSEENKKLLKLIEEERLVEDEIDLKSLKRDTNAWKIERLPQSAYSDFVTYLLERKRVRINKSANERIMRIERLPKFIRDQIPDVIEDPTESYRYTNSILQATNAVPQISDIHPLFQVAMDLMKKEFSGISWDDYRVELGVPEQLHVEIYEISIMEGTGSEIDKKLIHFARRQDNSIIFLEKNWLFYDEFNKNITSLGKQNDLKKEAMQHAFDLKNNLFNEREKQLNKMQLYLERIFNQQYIDTFSKLETYQKENKDNRNNALINQMNAKLIDLDIKKEERLKLIQQQKNISVKPPKRLISLEVIPNGTSNRVIADDFYEVIVEYEKNHGRMNVQQFDNLGIVDFSSERFNGEERYIILTNNFHFALSEKEYEQLYDVIDKVYIYYVQDNTVIEERNDFAKR